MVRGIARRITGRRESPRLEALKLRAIDVACETVAPRSLADLGGVWAVDGGYALYAVERHGVERALICDDDFTPSLSARAERDARIQLIRGNFGSADVSRRVGPVDAILLFDVLLHQVRPDWDRVLSLYAPQTRCVVIAGPWWTGRETIRLLDLGRDEYLRVVPLSEFHAPILERLDEMNERRGRPWRDVHDIWQWGITDSDLRARMSDLGFDLAHYENVGPWQGLERFENAAYVFTAT
jgi:hypothetical protein